MIASFNDLERILVIQKKAFKQEAILYNDYTMPPLTQTIEEFNKGIIFFKYEKAGTIIGSVRAELDNNICKIGRLVVDPNFQRQGIGMNLMNELEDYFIDKCNVLQIFMGEKSYHALSLYTKLGYNIINYRNIGEYNLVNMEKRI